MTAYNAGRSSQESPHQRVWHQNLSGRQNIPLAALPNRYASQSDTQGTENSEQTENERLRYKVKSLRTELRKTIDCLEQAHYAAARQKQLTEMKVSIVVSGLGDQYTGYENGRVI